MTHRQRDLSDPGLAERAAAGAAADFPQVEMLTTLFYILIFETMLRMVVSTCSGCSATAVRR
jgi:hypothetical protein